MEQHVKVLAILNIVLGVLGVLTALVALFFFGGLAWIAGMEPEPDAAAGAAVLGAIGAIGFLVLAVFSIPSIIAGYGLLHYRSWAQTLTIVLSVLNLINVPLGTAIGVYGLWVLLNEDTKPLFKVGATA